ncbi:unnamed protein product, partial [marine sediment metagenome]
YEIMIITKNLFESLVPLFVIMIPTFLLVSIFGKKLFMAIFLFMTIVVFAGGLIPFWILFVTLVSLGLIIYKNRGDL